MINQEIIPLTEELILQCSQDLYYICGSIRCLSPYCDITLSANNSVATILWSKELIDNFDCREALNVNTKSFRTFFKNAPTTITGNFIVLMPFEVWDLLMYSMKDLSVVERKTITRVFLYIYYYAMRHYGQYARAREKVIKILHINKDTFSNTVQWLEDNALIERSNYLKKVTARTYTIPAILWTEECKIDTERNKLK